MTHSYSQLELGHVQASDSQLVHRRKQVHTADHHDDAQYKGDAGRLVDEVEREQLWHSQLGLIASCLTVLGTPLAG